jgi:hypothetical protein
MTADRRKNYATLRLATCYIFILGGVPQAREHSWKFEIFDECSAYQSCGLLTNF